MKEILKKIDKLGYVEESKIKYIFDKEETCKIEELIKLGYLFSDSLIPYESCKEIRLSSLGRVKLFKLEYEKEVEAFVLLLEEYGEDTSYLDDFLTYETYNSKDPSVLNMYSFEKWKRNYK